jgi:Ku protein
VERQVSQIAQPTPSSVAPIRNTPTSAENAQPIPRAEIVKGYEYQPEQYVLVSDDELQRITPRTSSDIQILEVVQLSEIDPVYFETSYYVAPERAGEKPYSLLYAALRKTGYVALAQIAMHRREHIAVIRAGDRGILMHMMFYANEVRKEQEFKADEAQVADKELGLAVKLIEADGREIRAGEIPRQVPRAGRGADRREDSGSRGGIRRIAASSARSSCGHPGRAEEKPGGSS